MCLNQTLQTKEPKIIAKYFFVKMPYFIMIMILCADQSEKGPLKLRKRNIVEKCSTR